MVVTNPTTMLLPWPIKAGMSAQGGGQGARAIAPENQGVGAEHRVPMMEAPPWRSALQTTEIDAEIPSALYNAVAEVLATYIYQLAQLAAGRGVSGPAARPAGAA